ncbi:MAG: SET domain-containing protein-lysine N-methyltransferase [Candidatus Zambryskibacteria bacterium RIFOXYD1_FULL_40_13]|nr:MAG: Nuclear protein SET [Parcubacteria group bacterium GW2011_GWC1_39_12]KKR18598.1 MAG: Nuclear protein SET [Parcubacteria group bacterium GW2011_GWF1_39_37]KKR34795.1 MAG: Nuclear protein SET [Parcubacteria group bacterium GW2011_GWC2_40_10]KKR52748.1 MAG: Nuclear protein SET [Parcubacteria group bacterium GW2011_GWE1_40_20]KKR69072.1 MAG: Nuclear protein SET [Parcubacteria group bacterium GW2011_GWF2_40_69]KKS36274.1 MAG: Nuclear protein SET [Parcubacteria group bacterium GW2011_GWE2_42
MKNKFVVGNFALKVRKSFAGKGLFTLGFIPKGSCILEYTGKMVEEKDHYKDTKYLFWTDKKTMIDGNVPSNIARFINHSCRPNCEADGPKGRVYIISTKVIKPSEELTYDYGREYFNKHIKPKGCRCIKCKSKLS